MSLTRHLFANGSLARPVSGDAESWEFSGLSASRRVTFDPFARKVSHRASSLKVNPAGWRILLNVLRSR
jgi:hypothetical protein